MNEAQWLTSGDPSSMLAFVRTNAGDKSGGAVYPSTMLPVPLRVSDRKLRLFACACVRQVWHLLTNERSRQAVEVAERYADGKATAGEANIAWKKAVDDRRKYKSGGPWEAAYSAASVAEVATFDAGDVSYQMARRNVLPVVQADILRDIFGNPWKPAIAVCPRCDGDGEVHWPDHSFECTPGTTYLGRCPVCDGFRYQKPAWITPTVEALANEMYKSRDFTGMPVLSDALEEAGCDVKTVLDHCREQVPHIRGCHVIDILTGK